MPNKLIECVLNENTSVYIEALNVETSSSGRTSPAGSTTKLIEKGKHTFESVIRVIKPISEHTLSQIKQLVEPPNTLSIEYGIKFSVNGNAIIAAASGEATFKIIIEWKDKKN